MRRERDLARRSGRSRDGGFTLIEVLVALVVAVAAMALLSQGFSTGAKASVVSQNATRAAILAQRVMTDRETGELTSSGRSSGSFDDEPDFSYETRSETYETGVELFTVTVIWDERGQERTYELLRLFRERTTTTTP
jgi:prepilin-type N-terminal cleavage/methylation domain-containing protein